jgi:hypothetical protein
MQYYRTWLYFASCSNQTGFLPPGRILRQHQQRFPLPRIFDMADIDLQRGFRGALKHFGKNIHVARRPCISAVNFDRPPQRRCAAHDQSQPLRANARQFEQVLLGQSFNLSSRATILLIVIGLDRRMMVRIGEISASVSRAEADGQARGG